MKDLTTTNETFNKWDIYDIKKPIAHWARAQWIDERTMSTHSSRPYIVLNSASKLTQTLDTTYIQMSTTYIISTGKKRMMRGDLGHADNLVMCRARLGPKAAALAWLEAARALQISGPSQSPQWGPGSGLAWLRPRLLAEKYICI